MSWRPKTTTRRAATTASSIEQIGVAAVEREQRLAIEDRLALNTVIHTRRKKEAEYAYEPALQARLRRIVHDDWDPIRARVCDEWLRRAEAEDARRKEEDGAHRASKRRLDSVQASEREALDEEAVLRQLLLLRHRQHTSSSLATTAAPFARSAGGFEAPRFAGASRDPCFRTYYGSS